jgi:hypothetical protein
MVLDIFLAHSSNQFRYQAQCIPLWFSIFAPPVLLIGLFFAFERENPTSGTTLSAGRVDSGDQRGVCHGVPHGSVPCTGDSQLLAALRRDDHLWRCPPDTLTKP